MRYAIDTPLFDGYSDPRVMAELAREAEDAGWDGFFVWDHIAMGWRDTLADTWITLAAMAVATSRIRLGPLVTPLPRRFPWRLARETVTLDHLSQGRLVLGVGLGSDVFGELSTFGTPLEDRIRAGMLDEGLEILTRLWRGEPFSFAGKHYKVNDALFLPTPVQSPRIPIWVAATWPRSQPLRRAAKWDGVCPISGDIEKPIGPEEVAQVIATIRKYRTTEAPFDVIASGWTGSNDDAARALMRKHASAGTTWWLESVLPWQTPFEQVRDRIRLGPPRI
jgi:alkanesulfonate monooxygenase SsuD/methylene tetrahydromethanopterin reductase-like flavin-dependent oxidoreductase (luciferase family)